jgi:hypothetical protein
VTEADWKVADGMARGLVNRRCDPNEVAKALVFLRAHRDPAKLFQFLDVLAEKGDVFQRSGQTVGYYKEMREACGQLKTYQKQPAVMREVLGWTVRLMRYYRFKSPPSPDSRGTRPRDRRGPRR